MSYYRFSKVHLMWVPEKITPTSLIHRADDYRGAFPLSEFRAHCLQHTSRCCSDEHACVDPTTHSFQPDFEEVTLEASTTLFDGFCSMGAFSRGVNYASTTNGHGGDWVQTKESRAHQLLEDGKPITFNGDPKTTLYLEMTGEVTWNNFTEDFDLNTEDIESMGPGGPIVPSPMVVRLTRTRGTVRTVFADFRTDSGGERVELEATSDPRTFVVAPPAGTKKVTIDVEYDGEKPSLVEEPQVRPIQEGDVSTAKRDYELRKQEIAADRPVVLMGGPPVPVDEKAEADAAFRRKAKTFFLEFDTQFREDMRELWEPLTPREFRLAYMRNPRWRGHRSNMLELMLRTAGSLVMCRRGSEDRDDHEYRVRQLACAYGGPGSWDAHKFSSHLEELALAQEYVVARHFPSGGSSEIDVKQLARAFELFASGKLRSRPEAAFRNGEPDSGLMFFWAEFADQVLRWCGKSGTCSLTPEQTWFWQRFRDILIDAAENYRRHYMPTRDPSDPPTWYDYGAVPNPTGPHPQLLRAKHVPPSDFHEWKRMLELCFPPVPGG